ncbi:MAG: TraX family protein, partial [Firmicutes bacterium]|nr:TraX family protein [Bacillota bacterium]
MKNRRLIFSSFSLKLIALITMTIDHVGAIILYNVGYANTFIYILLRFIGRFAFPLFAFMIVEGVLHTKKPWGYFLRLALSAFSIGLILFLANLFLGEQVVSGNIFVDLLGGGLAVYFLRLKGEKKLLALLPTA